MKILVESFCKSESGPVLAHDITVGLKNNGIDVYCVITSEMENCESWINDIGSERVFLWNGIPSKKKPISLLINSVRLKYYFNKLDFDFVLLTNPGKNDLWAMHLFSYKENIMILHDVIPHSSTNNDLSEYVHKVISKADNILVMSKKFITIVCDMYNKKINNIFYMRHGLMKYPDYNGEHENTYKNSKINFLYFGRIDGYKGLHVLADAYRQLSVSYQNITLTIAGGGDFTEYTKEYNDLHNIKVINKYILDTEIAELFTRPNTVLVLPYLDATQSGVIGTGFNYLTPIIVSDTGGIKEQLFDGKVGVLVPAGDASSLQSAMERFIVDSTVYDTQVMLMKKYKGHMTWDFITREFVEQLKQHI